MAKKSVRAREVKRAKLTAKFATRRDELREIIKNPTASFEQKMEAQESLQKLPRDSNKIRGRSRCAITGRPRGVYRKFGLGRNKLREFAMLGLIPGLRKASW
jgi:small subunit ribosomal protein S14